MFLNFLWSYKNVCVYESSMYIIIFVFRWLVYVYIGKFDCVLFVDDKDKNWIYNNKNFKININNVY